jgi:hypothetical protein
MERRNRRSLEANSMDGARIDVWLPSGTCSSRTDIITGEAITTVQIARGTVVEVDLRRRGRDPLVKESPRARNAQVRLFRKGNLLGHIDGASLGPKWCPKQVAFRHGKDPRMTRVNDEAGAGYLRRAVPRPASAPRDGGRAGSRPAEGQRTLTADIPSSL